MFRWDGRKLRQGKSLPIKDAGPEFVRHGLAVAAACVIADGSLRMTPLAGDRWHRLQICGGHVLRRNASPNWIHDTPWKMSSTAIRVPTTHRPDQGSIR